MAKKRNHQVTRSILKSFPQEAAKVLGKKENIVIKTQKKKEKSLESGEEEKPEEYQSEGSEVESEEEEIDEVSEKEIEDDEDSVDFDASSGTEDDQDLEDEFSESELQTDRKKSGKEKSLGSAISHILKQNVPAAAEDSTSNVPILAKRKAIERNIEDAKLEARARAVLRRQKNASKDSGRVLVPDVTKANYERTLRKFATKGVVQLFNAIHQHQVNKEKLLKEKKDSGKKGEVAKEIKQISKTSFLEMLKGGASTIAIRK